MATAVKKLPLHEVLLSSLDKVLAGRGAWRENQASLLVEVLGCSTIPPHALPEVIARLEAIRRNTKRKIGIDPVLRSLKCDLEEHRR